MTGRTGRWRGVGAVALLAGALGVAAGRPALMLTGAFGVSFAAYARSAGDPAVELAVTRRLSDPRPAPGDAVEVTVTVANEGDHTAPDLRVADGVPDGLAVTDGSPRHAAALRPGKAATFRYEVEAVRGAHEFDPVTAAVRGFSGAREQVVRADDPTRLVCIPALGAPVAAPLRAHPTGRHGALRVDERGVGVEFHAVREYRRGDALARVDWKRRARTGDLATVEFRETHAGTVALVVDARAEAYSAPAPDADPAVERSVAAARHLLAGLLDAGHRVGVAALSPTPCWLSPGAGAAHRERARRLLATADALGWTPPAPGVDVAADTLATRLARRLPDAAQVVVLSACADDGAASAARRLDALGHPATVVSPDPTTDAAPANRLAGVRRTLRLAALRRAGVPVLDWPREEAFPDAARREGWSA